MTPSTALTPRHWAISARVDGEVLVARASDGALALMLLSGPSGYTAAEIEAWLVELIGVAVQARDALDNPPIPTLLHRVLTGLLFSHAELWERTSAHPPCSLAWFASPDALAFGWVGTADVRVSVNDETVSPAWVRVRDSENREARALSFDPSSSVRVVVRWESAGEDGIARRAEVTADWGASPRTLATDADRATTGAAGNPAPAPPALHAPDAPVPAVADVMPIAAAEPAAESPREPHPEWQFRSWVNLLGLGATPRRADARGAHPDEIVRSTVGAGPADAMAAAPPEAFVPAESELVPPTPEPPGLTALTVAIPGELTVEIPGEEETESEPTHEVEAEIVHEPNVEEWPGDTVDLPAGPEPTPEPESEPAAEFESGVEFEFEPEFEPEFESEFDPEFDPESQLEEPVLEPGPEIEPAIVVEPQVGPEPKPEPEPEPAGAAASSLSPPADEFIHAPIETPFEDPTPDGESGSGTAAVQAPELAPVGSSEEAEVAEDPVSASGGSAARGARPRSAPRSWPDEPERRMPWGRLGVAALIVALLFGAGWILGATGTRERGPLAEARRMLSAIGLGPGTFHLAVDSQPQGAWIGVDGKDLAQRTPASLELRSGAHQITLRLQGLGSASYAVSGKRGERVPLAGQLFGSLSITNADPDVPITVAVDEVTRGPLPVTVDGLAPGIHKVEFTAPGVGGWEQTAEVRIHETNELVAHPLAASPTGFLQVQATLGGGGEPQPVSGARVWVDGDPRGVTPLRLELPRGPHSVRVAWRAEASGVQVIDLPGGNTRFATFELGTDVLPPRIAVAPIPARIPRDPPTVISATLAGVAAPDLREMWLHVSTPEGAWRRYAMNLLRTPGSVAGVAVFPAGSFDASGRARWYVSALVAAGDEYFTEIQTVQTPDR